MILRENLLKIDNKFFEFDSETRLPQAFRAKSFREFSESILDGYTKKFSR